MTTIRTSNNRNHLADCVECWQRWASAEAYAQAGLSPDHPPVDPLEALAANRFAVEILTAGRSWAVRAARAAGYTWCEINNVTGLSPESLQQAGPSQTNALAS